jgi:antiphage defense system Thoeris ThsB-like protein
VSRRVFFSFHYDNDIWRANQIRNTDAVAGSDIAGFFDHAEYEAAKTQGDEGIERMILRHLRNTAVTVLLIGTETAYRPWVKYAIEKSIEQGNGLLGIYIHQLKVQFQRTPAPGRKPAVPAGVEFPSYTWDGDVDRFRNEIEEAGRRSDAIRRIARPT